MANKLNHLGGAFQGGTDGADKVHYGCFEHDFLVPIMAALNLNPAQAMFSIPKIWTVRYAAILERCSLEQSLDITMTGFDGKFLGGAFYEPKYYFLMAAATGASRDLGKDRTRYLEDLAKTLGYRQGELVSMVWREFEFSDDEKRFFLLVPKSSKKFQSLDISGKLVRLPIAFLGVDAERQPVMVLQDKL